MAGKYKHAKNKRAGKVSLQRIKEHDKCLQYIFLILVQFLLGISEPPVISPVRSLLIDWGFFVIMSTVLLNLCKFLI